MNAMTCCCAPAPIDSMAITAATPKIMPSIVSARSQLVRAQIVEPLLELGQHVEAATRVAADGEGGDGRVAHFTGPDAAPLFGALAAVDTATGSTSATIAPSARPSRPTRVSVR